MLHIGQRIKEVFDQEPKRHSIKWFSEQLGNERNNIYNIFNRAAIDTELLRRISKILNHNFFQDLAEDFEREQNEKDDFSDGQIRKQIYVGMMKSIGNVVKREIKHFDIKKRKSGRICINRLDDETSPLPPDKFKLFVYQMEDENVIPHLHLYSAVLGYEIRVNFDGQYISTKKSGKVTDPKDFNLKEFSEWLEAPSILNPTLTNRQQAISIFRMLNPIVKILDED